MVINRKEDSDKNPAKQGAEAVISEPNKIGVSTPFDFGSTNLTAYGGLLPVAAMLERLGFQQLVEETLTVKRITRAMPMYQFVLAMVLAAYVGFTRMHHLRFIAREPMLTSILKVLRLPPQEPPHERQPSSQHGRPLSLTDGLRLRAQHPLHRQDELLPACRPCRQPPAPGRRERVHACPAVVLGRPPSGLDPTTALKPVKRGVEGPLLHLENITGDLLDAFGNRPAVLWAKSNGPENQEVQRTLRKLDSLLTHSTPCTSTRRV